ncbi:Uncharacterised protein [Chlamydia abortus]|uniref:DHHW family protein n=1 Tax=Paenibacillus sp. SAFN-117 TaxID=3436860 RepID=UPI000A27C852|nr:Uncharacterised protein [Chlamydia abortus]
MPRLFSYIISCFFMVILLTFSIATFASSERNISEVENRTLAKKPKISLEEIRSGNFSKQLEVYFSDQLFKRDMLIKAYTSLQIKVGKTIVNDVIIGEDNWLMETPTVSTNKKSIDIAINSMNNLSTHTNGNEVLYYLALVPHKKNILAYKYPSFLGEHTGVDNHKYFVNKLNKKWNVINIYDQFVNKFTNDEIEKMYFKTDHHWNAEGAYQAFQIMIREMTKNGLINNRSNLSNFSYDFECNDLDFIGSYSRKIFNMIKSDEELTCRYTPSNFTDLIYFESVGRKKEVINEIEKVFGTGLKNQTLTYAGLFSSDYPELKFKYDNVSDVNLLILKDSYANPMIPSLAQYFSETYVLDLRHYKEMNVYQYIKEKEIDAVLVLYHDGNISGDMYNFE